VHAFKRGAPLPSVAELCGALTKSDTVVKAAIARFPKDGAVPGAVVTVIAVAIAMSTTALAPAAEAADTLSLLMPDRAAAAARSGMRAGTQFPAWSTALIALENVAACAPSGGLMRP